MGGGRPTAGTGRAGHPGGPADRTGPPARGATVGGWLAGLGPPPPPAVEPPTPREPWTAVAVDGKTLRGSGPAGGQVHLLAVIDHITRAVRGQVDVAGKTNEITAFRPLLYGLDLARTVVTADPLHTQREHADWLVTAKNAAYICIVKQNQPGLYRQLKSLPGRQVPAGDDTRNAGHGRDKIRRLQVVTVIGLAFPQATQAIGSPAGSAPAPAGAGAR